jgi:hypothetical protein
MRSQVQVLAGPPPIIAGHSAAGTEPGALAAGLGRAGAARHPPPAPPIAPPGPPTRPVGSATTTHRGHGPSPRTPATRRVPPPRAAACSRVHRAAARDGRSGRRPGLLVAQRARAAAAARTPPGGSGRHRPPRDQRDFASVAPHPRPPGLSPEPSRARQPQGPPPVPVVRVARSPRPGPHRHCLSGRRRTRPDRRGQTPDGWTPHGWTSDSWTPDSWTAAVRPPDPLDDDPR